MECLRTFRFVVGKFFGAFDKFPKLLLTLAVLILVLKTRPSDVPAVIKPLADILGDHFSDILGWIVAVITIIASVTLVFVMRRIHKAEIDRIVKERDSLQQILINRPVQHSEELIK